MYLRNTSRGKGVDNIGMNEVNTHMYIYICIYVYMYICIYVHMYMCIYVYMYICVYVYMYICSNYDIGMD